MQWVMFDLETLGTTADCVVLTLGAVRFDPRSNHIDKDSLLLKFNVDEQTARGRTISESTMEWWSKQKKEIVEDAFSDQNRVSVEHALEQFRKFVWNNDRIWSQGSFDVNIMENMFMQFGYPVPWNYWQVRDSRTLFDIVDGELDRSKHHNAVADAVSQAQGVQHALKKIGWAGEKL
jgi:hypothetical protein